MGNAKLLDNQGNEVVGLMHSVDWQHALRLRDQSGAHLVMGPPVTGELITDREYIWEHRVYKGRCTTVQYMGKTYVLSDRAKIGAVIQEAWLQLARSM